MWLPLFLLFLSFSHGRASPPFFESYGRGMDLPDSPDLQLETQKVTRDDEVISYRLPGNISPESYELQLAPDFDTDNYTGSVLITFNVLSDTNVIVIHKKEIDIQETDIVVQCETKGYGIVSTNSSGIEDQYFFNIYLNDTLTTGSRCTLDIQNFQSQLNTEANNGFYLGRYTDEDGVEQKFAMTKFEPTHARRAFPCFDEPALKAVFTVSILRPTDYHSNSNTPLASHVLHQEGLTLDTFNQTVRMSTYLVSFVVSKFDYTEKLERHRIFGRPSEINSGRAEYTLKLSNNSLNTLEELLNVPYTLEKMDQLAVPEGYFTSGAMEDWGMVTYREAYLFYYGNGTTHTYKQYMNTVISHEFSHQWFGDLVSPLWWSYLWLNEGFASYFEFKTVAEMEPTWEMMEQFIIKDTQYAMIQDSTATIRHMNKDAQTPTEIAALFDRVAYDKAGSVIYQLETIVTSEIFYEGLTIYLNNKSFSNAEPSDLYNGIQAAVDAKGYNIADGLTVAEIMETWTENAGYPVLTVERNYNDGSVNLSQSRFLSDSTANVTTTNTLWYIPINTATKSNYDFENFDIEFFLTQASAVKNLNLVSDEWLLINKGERGYYRVNYDETNWKLLTDYLNSENYNQISKTSRAQLIDDSFNLAKSGRLKYEIPLNLLSLFSRDTDYIPYYPLVTALSHLDTVLAATDQYDDFKNYVVSLLEVAYDTLGVLETESDAHTTIFQRANIVNWACKYGLGKCRQDALEALRSWEDTGVSPLTATLEQNVLCGALRNGTEVDWDFVFQQYVSSNISLQRTRFLQALACSENSTILVKYFNLALTSPDVASSDRANIFTYVYSKGNIELQTELEYIKENFHSIMNVTSITTALTGIGGALTTQAQVEALEELQAAYSSYSPMFTAAISAAKSNVEWCDKYLEQITSWVKELSGSATSAPVPTAAPTTSAPQTTTPADSGVSSIFYHPIVFVLPIFFSLFNR